MSSCGMYCAKYFLCIFNFLFFILGTIVLGTGIWLAVDKASLIGLLEMMKSEQVHQFTQVATIEQLAYVLIACGALTVVMSFLGYIGSIRESKCLLSTYAVFMILLLVTEILSGGLALGYKDRATSETKTFLQSTISNYYSNSTAQNGPAVTNTWDRIMTTFSCCGVEDYMDFEYSAAWKEKKGNATIPPACCVKTSNTTDEDLQTCTAEPTEENSNFKKSCYESVAAWINFHRIVVLAVLLAIVVVQLFAIFLSFCLCKSFAKYHGLRL